MRLVFSLPLKLQVPRLESLVIPLSFFKLFLAVKQRASQISRAFLKTALHYVTGYGFGPMKTPIF